ncbi:MAG: MFS transporter, partial [Dehalococcoidia bacterium]
MNLDAENSRRRMYHGWRIVAFSSIFHGLFGGLYHTGIAVYFLPITRTFEISHAKMSLAFSLRSLEGGIEGPFVGYLVDRIGPKPVIFVGVIMGGVGFILLSA